MSSSTETPARMVDLVFDRSDELASAAHQQVVFCRNLETGLRAIIAVHDTTLGPALGGTRFYPYRSESEALTDVLRLSQGMTYKAAAAGIALGGGKAVIIGAPDRLKTRDLLLAFGRFVDSLAGRYYTAADVGTTADDLDVIAETTRYVVGKNADGGSGDSGFSTAYGVFSAMRTAADFTFGPDGLTGRTVGVEGIGKVGSRLVELLVGAGVTEVLVADPNRVAVERLVSRQPRVRPVASVIDAPVDIYAPCALGATLTHESVRGLRAAVVCGGANNQLAHGRMGEELRDRGIVWVPDYIANAGGLIQVRGELDGATDDEVRAKVAGIAETVAEVLTRSQQESLTTSEAADAMVRERLERARAVNRR